MLFILVLLCLALQVSCNTPNRIVFESCAGCRLNRYPELKKLLHGGRLLKFANCQIKWIPGAPPKYKLFHDDELISETEIPFDHGYDLLVQRLKKENFHFLDPVHALPQGYPMAETEFGGHKYEYYIEKNFFEPARQFAESRTRDGKKGRLVTINCASQNAHLAQFMSAVETVPGVWLGATDLEEGVWKWISGPMAGEIFWRDQAVEGVYSNWKAGEPNNVDNEDCVVMGADGWNDEACEGVVKAILVEYGDEPLICDSIHTPQLGLGDTVPEHTGL